MSKPGQAADPTILTAGYRVVINELTSGTAGKAGQAHAANWLRDLYRHRHIGNQLLEQNSLYQQLLAGTCEKYAAQRFAATWISNLLDGVLTEDELNHMPPNSVPLGANERQVAGDHYNKRSIQHWDFAVGNELSYLGGQASKYVSRWKDKNGVTDLQKAQHFLQKMIEVHSKPPTPIGLTDYFAAQDLGWHEQIVIGMIFAYERTLDPALLRHAAEALQALLDQQTKP
jgi:hypothetical protein